mmetsp:Transcript_11751/g.21223  ORF Transcript_11751/g.21223 Transcript_11751/m.21223 type:complete len:401 (-) Transcript_11751:356-1558(-)
MSPRTVSPWVVICLCYSGCQLGVSGWQKGVGRPFGHPAMQGLNRRQPNSLAVVCWWGGGGSTSRGCVWPPFSQQLLAVHRCPCLRTHPHAQVVEVVGHRGTYSVATLPEMAGGVLARSIANHHELQRRSQFVIYQIHLPELRPHVLKAHHEGGHAGDDVVVVREPHAAVHDALEEVVKLGVAHARRPKRRHPHRLNPHRQSHLQRADAGHGAAQGVTDHVQRGVGMLLHHIFYAAEHVLAQYAVVVAAEESAVHLCTIRIWEGQLEVSFGGAEVLGPIINRMRVRSAEHHHHRLFPRHARAQPSAVGLQVPRGIVRGGGGPKVGHVTAARAVPRDDIGRLAVGHRREGGDLQLVVEVKVDGGVAGLGRRPPPVPRPVPTQQRVQRPLRKQSLRRPPCGLL